MTVVRLYTEAKANVGRVAARYFPGFTLFRALGKFLRDSVVLAGAAHNGNGDGKEGPS